MRCQKTGHFGLFAKFLAWCYFRSTFCPSAPSKGLYEHERPPGFEPPGAANPRHSLPARSGDGGRGPEKGHVRHEQDGPRYVYLPTLARDNAQRSALRHILQTFFDGSAEQAISALLDDRSTRFSPAELDRLALMIDTARKSGA